jgi:hypothetical protein
MQLKSTLSPANDESQLLLSREGQSTVDTKELSVFERQLSSQCGFTSVSSKALSALSTRHILVNNVNGGYFLNESSRANHDRPNVMSRDLIKNEQKVSQIVLSRVR